LEQDSLPFYSAPIDVSINVGGDWTAEKSLSCEWLCSDAIIFVDIWPLITSLEFVITE